MPEPRKAYDEPSKVKVEDSKVEVRGPDAVDVDLTPEAAEETSDRLLEGALEARGHKKLEKMAHRPK